MTRCLSVSYTHLVKSIELGAQSMDDRVLVLNQRGHTAQDVVNASRMIREYGFSLGLQMMTGLYGSSPESDWQTGKKLVLCKPDCVRIYPTVVLKLSLIHILILFISVMATPS